VCGRICHSPGENCRHGSQGHRAKGEALKSLADIEKLYQLANFLINERGYVVLGDVHGRYSRGDIVKDLWNVIVDQPFRLTGTTDLADWKEQGAIAGEKFRPEFKTSVYKYRGETEHLSATIYWKAITD
jgi:hypothetical protein